MNNIITLQMDRKIFNTLIPAGISVDIDIRDFVLEPVKKKKSKKITETEYLTSTKANKKALEEAIYDVEENKNLTEMEFVNGILMPKLCK